MFEHIAMSFGAKCLSSLLTNRRIIYKLNSTLSRGRHFRVLPFDSLCWWLITARWICMRATERVIWILNTWILQRHCYTEVFIRLVPWKYKGAIRLTTEKKQLSSSTRQIDHYLYCSISWFTWTHMDVAISLVNV